MMRSTIRVWYLTHKWTSLICTAFLLILCVTGLPLIFHHEIDALMEKPGSAMHDGPASSGGGPGLLPLDTILAKALAARPGEIPLFMALSNDDPLITVTTAPDTHARRDTMTLQLFDRTTGTAVGKEDDGGIMALLLQIHTDMLLGLWGELFLGAMGLLFVTAIVSGVVLYAPFMRKLDFGTLRTSRSARLKWLDYHNLLGITALAWMSVVGITGVINSFEKPITALWQANELKAMTAAYAGRPPLAPSHYASIDKAMQVARAARPGARPQFIAFPGSSFSTPHHYGIFLQGGTPLTERLLSPALIDAESDQLTDIRPMPWYMAALALSQPLHFGDYGGLPMKLLWGALDLFTIVVLGTGLYLWIGRRKMPAALLVRDVETGGLTLDAAA
jgi:uncharacterized iron-regulated membrane protein